MLAMSEVERQKQAAEIRKLEGYRNDLSDQLNEAEETAAGAGARTRTALPTTDSLSTYGTIVFLRSKVVEEVWIQAKVGNGGMVDGSAGEKANGKVIRAQTSDQMIVAA